MMSTPASPPSRTEPPILRRPPRLLAAAIVLALLFLAGCSADDTGTDDARKAGAARCAEPGAWGDCELSEFDDRGYDVYVPTRAASEPVSLMVALHGAGGRSGTAISTTCADGDRSDASCLHTIAEDEGFAVVYPNGSGLLPFGRLRAWNAGGGGDWDCTSGRACEDNVDDVAYIAALLDDVEGWLDVDSGRITIVGHSNGGAMSHRLACELSDRVAAFAAVGGTNQFATTAPCEPDVPVAIMQVHGTEDTCWSYETSDRSCAELPIGGRKLGVDESTEGWVEVTVLRVDGGGHTWPGGDAPLPELLIGRATQDWDSTVIWEFLARWETNTLGV